MNVENIGRVTISLVAMVAYLAFVFIIMRLPIPPEMRDVIMQAHGLLGGGFTLALGYWIGSSAGSAAKDKTITTLSNKP